MRNEKKKGRGMFAFSCILAFAVSFGIGAVSKIAIKPAWTKNYEVEWSDELGTLHKDIFYGTGDANKFDL